MKRLAFPALLSLVFLCGCVGTPIQVTRGFVRIHDAVASEYRTYVQNDFSMPPADQERRLRTVEEWDKLTEAVRPTLALPYLGVPEQLQAEAGR